MSHYPSFQWGLRCFFMSSTTPSNHCQKVKFRPGRLSYKKKIQTHSIFLAVQMFIRFTVSCWALKTSWPHPVKLGPWYGHVAVVLRVVAAACKTLLCQEDQVIIWQATAAMHFCLVLHIESLTQLGPQNLVWHNEWHPALRTWGRVVNIANTPGKEFISSLTQFIYSAVWHPIQMMIMILQMNCGQSTESNEIHYLSKVWTHLLIEWFFLIFTTTYIVDSHWRHQNYEWRHMESCSKQKSVK